MDSVAAPSGTARGTNEIIGFGEKDLDSTLLLRNNLVGSHDPIFGASYYSGSKKLVMRIKISMS